MWFHVISPVKLGISSFSLSWRGCGGFLHRLFIHNLLQECIDSTVNCRGCRQAHAKRFFGAAEVYEQSQ